MKFHIAAIPSIEPCEKSNLTTRILLAAVLLLAASVRFAYLAQLQNDPEPFIIVAREEFDQYRFMQLANEFLGGNWLGSEVTSYSPAYSYLIAALYKIFPRSINTVFIFQILSGILAVYVLYKTTGLLFENTRVGLVAALIAAIYSPFIFYEGCLVRASVIAYSNLIGFYFLLKAVKEDKGIHFLTGGILLGISLVMRPNILPFFIIPYLLIAVKRPYASRALYAAVFILGLVLVISPLSVRNRILGRNVLISHQGPASFWVGNTYNSSGITFPPRSLRDNKLVQEAGGSIPKTIKIFLREIRKHPREYKSLYGRKIKMYFNGIEIRANLSYNIYKLKHSMLRLCFLDFAVISPLAILGMFLAWRHYRGEGLVYIFLFVLSFSVILFHVQGRYRLPAVPFFIIFSAYTIYWLARMIKEKNFFALSCACIALAIIAAYTKPDIELMSRYFEMPTNQIDDVGIN